MADIDELITDVECHLRTKQTSEVKSWEVGNLVIDKLRDIDNLSYLLFASVYRDFNSIEDFIEEIQQLQKKSAE